MSQNVQEKEIWNISGFVGLILCLICFGIAFLSFNAADPVPVLGVVLMIIGVVTTTGFTVIQPLEARVIQFFGQYVGTVRKNGLRWTFPLTTKDRVSLRLRNFESPKLKVNEAEGNPIEIAAIVVWKVVDSAQAMFNVDALERFVEKQTESALRMLATKYPYDRHENYKISLHENIDEVNEQLRHYVGQSVSQAGVQIVEARISLLAYAPEIAAAMLQRQQAQAIIAARQKIVDGAVGMVDMAIRHIEKSGFVPLDDERKAAMVSNLLVVLCSERPSQPVLNTGTIY